jgi:hypothetical protein
MHADAFGGAAGVVVGRGVAGRGQGAAGGSGGVGRVAGRSWVVGADRGAVQARGDRGQAGGVDRWAPDDRDGDLHPVDGAQGALPVGVPVVGGGGVGLDSSAPVLPDQFVGAGAGRVDGPQAHQADRGGHGQRDHARVDRGSDPVQAVPTQGGQDRFDGDRGGRALPDRRGPGGAWGADARAGSEEAREAGQGAEAAGAGSLQVDGADPAGCDAHDPSPLGGGEVRGAEADRADGRAVGELDRGDQAAGGDRRAGGRVVVARRRS